MKTLLRVCLVLSILLVLVLSLSACEGMEILNEMDGFTVIFNKTTAASTTAEPAVTTAEPAVTTAPLSTTSPVVTTTAPITTAAPKPPKEILKAVYAPTIDGLIDDAYLKSASFFTAYQPMNGNLPDPMAMVDPYTSAAMMEILRGHAVKGATAAAARFYFLWGEEAGVPYIYVAIEVTDTTKYERGTAYTSHPNPWINDNLELYYHFGADTAPSMLGQSAPYPVYNGVVRDSKTGSNLLDVGASGYHEPSAVAAERSVYFNEIECAVSGRDAAGDTAYVIEYKIPAKTESYSGKPTANGNFNRYTGRDLAAGDRVYFAYQINDLTGLPSGYTTTSQYDAKIATFGGAAKYPNAFTYVCAEGSAWRAYEDAIAPYVYSAGNSRPSYLNAAGAAPMCLVLSEDTVEGPYDFSDFDVCVDDVFSYTGSPYDRVDVIRPAGAKSKITYQRVNANGAVLADLGETKPVECGRYKVTVRFSWISYNKVAPLPEPMIRYFTIVPGSLAARAGSFGAQNKEILFEKSLDFDPLVSDLVTGTLPKGIVRRASVVKLSSATDVGNGTAVSAAGRISGADGAGYYRVVISYAEVAGVDNYNDEHSVSHTAIVYVRDITKTAVKVADGAITVDGMIDSLYGEAAFVTAHQPCTTKLGPTGEGVLDKIDMTNLVDPYEKAALLHILRGASLAPGVEKNAASAKFYFAWDGNYIYVAIEVTDATKFERTAAYTSHPNPWVNDCVELYYHFGGAVPSLKGESAPYPVYNAVVCDSKTGSYADGSDPYHPTTVVPAKSYYFNEVRCAVSGRDEAGDDTYVIEYKIPARTESYYDRPAADGYVRIGGEPLSSGEHIYFAYQINDMMGLPDGYTTTEQYDARIAGFEGNKYPNVYTFTCVPGSGWDNLETVAARYVYSAGNSRPAYLNTEGCAPMILVLGE